METVEWEIRSHQLRALGVRRTEESMELVAARASWHIDTAEEPYHDSEHHEW